MWANCDEGVGEAIPITLTLSEAVTVSGTPNTAPKEKRILTRPFARQIVNPPKRGGALPPAP
jgi:hypothetical protein